jgi:plasmid stabilization system protein ParE
MSYTVTYFNEVIRDVREAKNWYKSKRNGLEIEFALAIESTIAQLAKTPTAYAIRYKTIRIARTKIFPYNIHFYLNEVNLEIVITAIVHNKRQLNIAKGRIDH